MLENGRFPKVFGWKECLQAHLEHEKHIYTNMYNYELSKLESRLNIVNGIILAINKIDLSNRAFSFEEIKSFCDEKG